MPKSVDFPASAAQRQELSCTNVIPAIQYMESQCGAAETSRVVESLGLPMAFLQSKSNWVSYDYFNELLSAMVEATGDEKAPYKAPLSIKPQEVFEYALYATQALLWYGGLRLPYRLILGSDLYRRWTKIGRFEILSSTSRSIEVEMRLDGGYKQTKNNCYAIQGMLAAIPIGVGLPAAEVTETRCAVDGHEGCVYEVRWRNPKRSGAHLALPGFALIAVLQLTVFRGLFDAGHVVVTGLVFLALGLLAKNYQFRRNLRDQERVNHQRNTYLVHNLEKVEEDYQELLEAKTALLERSEFLSVIGLIGETVRRETTIDSLLVDIRRILSDKLKFERGDFFRYSRRERCYRSIFGSLAEVPGGQYRDLREIGSCIPLDRLESDEVLYEWSEADSPHGMLFILPVEAPDVLSGFFCFYSSALSVLSLDLVNSLFLNIADQLRIGFAKINARAVIDDILSAIPEYVLIFSLDTFLIRYVNTHFYRSFKQIGRGEEVDIIGKSLFDVLDINAETERNIRRIMDRLEADQSSEVFETAVGPAVLEYSVFSIPRSAEGEKLVGIILSDVTEEKSFQQKMLTSEKLVALGRVAGGIAHEINNPLYAVLAGAEDIAEDDAASEDTRHLAGEIVDHVMSISAVVKDLSSYSKTMRKESVDNVDMNSVLQESLKLVKYGSNFMEIDTEMHLESLPAIRAVRGEMQQVFINLFTNAVWAMEQKGALSICSHRCDNGIQISVGDTGIGIDEENLPHIFNYLFTTKAPGEGTGQGLSIAKRLTERNGGEIRVESVVGSGTVFHLSFPVMEASDG
jgi:signal transduction histidine kinase